MPDAGTSGLESPLAMMARETRVQRGPVSHQLAGETLRDGTSLLSGDAFLLRAEGGIGLLYRKGEGVTLEQPAGADERDVSLWLNGMLYAAVAAINGLLPVHASAVAWDGQVYAFTGPPGAGKSTLTAALGRHSMPMMCDDTLVLDLRGDGAITCLPGHKQLKLWPEGLALAGATRKGQVAAGYPKYFAEPSAGIITQPLPLARLIFLEQGNDPEVLPLSGGERIARLLDDHYTAQLYAAASSSTAEARFDQLARIAARIKMARFRRPFDTTRFEDSTRYIARYITEIAA